MVNAVAISNVKLIPRAEERVAQAYHAKPVILAGKKNFLKTDLRLKLITWICTPIFIAIGIALIAAFASPVAITFGVAIIGLTLISLPFIYRNSKKYVKSIENAVKLNLKHTLGLLEYKNDLTDLPKIEWEQTKKSVKIKVTKQRIDALKPQKPVGFIAGYGAISEKINKLPFVVTLGQDINGQKYLSAIVFSNKLKKKDFSFEFEDYTMLLQKNPISIGLSRKWDIDYK